MKLTHLILCVAMLFLGVQCTSMSTTNPDGTTQKVTAFGGSGAYRNGKTRLAWDNRKSFRDFMLGLVGISSAGATAYGEAVRAGVDKANLAAQTSQHAATQATARNAQNVGGNVVNTANGINGGLELPAQIVTPSGY